MVVGAKFSGYIDDDAEAVHHMLVKNWPKGDLKDLTIFYYDETDDPATFDFKTGEIAVRVYADEISIEPKGISFDSESAIRTIRIDVRGINREETMLCTDQIRRIIAENRIRPFNDWQTMYTSMFTPIYPSFKFYHSTIVVTLRKYYTILPCVNTYGVSRY